ncbi:MAG: MgtC/SapB family protein [Solirubrobacterales bacterium]|jgi:hypothetical protein
MARKRRKQRPRRPPPAADPAPQPPAKPVAAAPRPRKIDDERPPAPWGSFPLVEIVVLVGLLMLVAALFTDGDRSSALLAVGLALGSLAGLELSIREHFGGFRSHTVVLAGAAGVATLAVLFYVFPGLLPPVARIAVGAVVAAAAAFGLARAFQARSGRLVKLR